MLLSIIKKIPEGYSEGRYQGKKYGISRKSFNGHRSFKIYAEELGGKDFISLNFYITSHREVLKPCEMPQQKVLEFLKNVNISPLY